MVKVSDFDYLYPPKLVAFYPSEKRDASRMLVLDRATGKWMHRFFLDFPRYFSKGDVLVVNDSKVIPSQLITRKKTGGIIECLLLKEMEPSVWSCLIKASKKLEPGTELNFSNRLKGMILPDRDETPTIQLNDEGDLESILNKIGHVPLPPYIKREDEPNFDRVRYQTVYAQKPGSVAAPTAGFHFTKEILGTLKSKGVQILDITLHVGIGTFLPIREQRVEAHRMHGEYYEIPRKTAEVVNEAKKIGKSISVVGTTTVRALESAWHKTQGLKAGRGYTEKFIHPPYAFNVVDRLLTNFHQPKSTLLVLVSTFCGRELILKVYQEAIHEKYRLFSYGDCMWIV